jgi:hypothetical protein
LHLKSAFFYVTFITDTKVKLMHGITHVNCDHAMEHNSDGVGERRGEAEKKKGKVAEHVRNAIAVSGAGALFGMIIDFCSLFATE